MKKISVKNTVNMLDELHATELQKELVLNIISQYNDLVTAYKKGEKVNEYLMYQLSLAVAKELRELQKINLKSGKQNKKSKSGFANMMEKMQN